MICLICRNAQLIKGSTTVNFERGELRLKIVHVPALVCAACGEAYLDEDVTTRLLAKAEEMSDAGMIEGVRDFS
jgi:YgiT-type zinc finger domain-containing protein